MRLGSWGRDGKKEGGSEDQRKVTASSGDRKAASVVRAQEEMGSVARDEVRGVTRGRITRQQPA